MSIVSFIDFSRCSDDVMVPFSASIGDAHELEFIGRKVGVICISLIVCTSSYFWVLSVFYRYPLLSEIVPTLFLLRLLRDGPEICRSSLYYQ